MLDPHHQRVSPQLAQQIGVSAPSKMIWCYFFNGGSRVVSMVVSIPKVVVHDLDDLGVPPFYSYGPKYKL